MKIEGLGRAKRAVRRAKEILISGHVNPDGDSIGSLLSLGMGLERLGKRVYMVSCDGIPHKYMGLPGAGRIIKNVDKPVDLAISVDCSSKEILGPTYSAFQKAGKILEIDHHAFRRPFGDIAILDNKAAAVGELVYIFLSGLGVVITKDIAQNLMTSIIVETNSFRLPKVRPFTFQTCTKLVDIDIDFYKLVDMIFWSMRRESAILSGICMSRCKFLKGGRIAWSIIRKKDFDAANGRDEDVDAVPDEMRSIRSVKIALLFREANTGVLRVSLRSKNSVNVANLAEYYNGGGHFDVAGCSIPNDAGAIKEFLNRASRLIE